VHIGLVGLTDKEIIEQERDIIVHAMRSGHFKFSAHAYDRCGDRSVTRRDVMEVGFNYDDWEPQEDGKHLFIGRDLDGVDLEVVAAYDGETIIVTVI
jgi:hypothetical protein